MSDPQAAVIKKEIRNRLRKARVEYAASLPPEVSALVFHRCASCHAVSSGLLTS